MATLDELHRLHNHHEEIPGGTKTTISRQYDEIIISLANDESRLRQQLDEGIARQTQEVDRSISERKSRLLNADGFTVRIRFTFQYWVAGHLTKSPYPRPLERFIDQEEENVTSHQT